MIFQCEGGMGVSNVARRIYRVVGVEERLSWADMSMFTSVEM